MLIIEMKNRIALLGGTFDPVHIGHLRLFHNAYIEAGVSHLILIPAYLSNFKQNSNPVSFSSRLEMLRLSVLDYREMFPSDELDIEISSYEGEKKGISYTSETIKDFHARCEENGKVNFIIGDDILPSLNKWHDFDYIKSSVRFLCFTRDGGRGDWGVEIEMYPSPITVASSSAVRAGDGTLLSMRVKEYIDEHQLYRAL